MAILEEDLPGISVTIRIKDQDLTEYYNADQELVPVAGGGPKLVCKYIECADDAEFKIHLEVDGRYDLHSPEQHTLNMAAFIDGTWRSGELCRWTDTFGDAVWEKDIEGRQIRRPGPGGDYVTQAFRFAKVKTVDDADRDQIIQDTRVAASLGTIEVKIYRVVEMGRGATLPDDVDGAAALLEIAEKALKGRAISHSTSFAQQGNRVLDCTGRLYYRQCRNIDKEPVAIFRFVYRSRKALEQKYILTPSKNGDDRSRRSATLDLLDNLSADQIRELARRQLMQDSPSPELNRVKPELGRQPSAERPDRKPKISAWRDGREVIDLLGDNSD